jgi:hypothetical protein
MSSTMSFNVDDYTIAELLKIINLNSENFTSENVTNITRSYIVNFRQEDPRLSSFFQDVQTKLLRYLNTDDSEKNEFEPNTEQTDKWYKNEVLQQNDETQKNKNTDRRQKIDIYDNDHMPMNREQLGINNNINVPVAQDTLNPNLKNVTTRFINLDSQFRQSSDANGMSTDYTMDLSEPLTNVLSLRLYSFQIPYTWYSIDKSYKNDVLWVVNNGTSFKVTLASGNYNSGNICNALLNAFKNSFFTSPFTPEPPVAEYNNTNGIITLKLDQWVDPFGNTINGIDDTADYDRTINPSLKFFDINNEENPIQTKNPKCISANQTYYNSTLGWMLGFRSPTQPILKNGNAGGAIMKLSGTKYFILILDDYNRNHINNGLVSITELSKKLEYPSYFTPEYLCLRENQTIEQQPVNFDFDNTNDDNYFNSLGDKLNRAYGSIPQIIPTAPRTLTQAQIYTINEIIKNRKMNTSIKPKAPTNADTFSLIPIKYSGLNIGDMYVDFSGSLQDNPRIYFGPVDIDRLRIRLVDDMGRTVNLHGVDWSVTLISENLYQY